MNPETTRKAPRTAAAAYNGHDYLLKECRTLEIETQELSEAMQLAIDYAAGRETEWGDRAVQSFDILESALARHRANQEVAP